MREMLSHTGDASDRPRSMQSCVDAPPDHHPRCLLLYPRLHASRTAAVPVRVVRGLLGLQRPHEWSGSMHAGRSGSACGLHASDLDAGFTSGPLVHVLLLQEHHRLLLTSFVDGLS